ncbi:CGNR zinc finger domain-containing protein [Naumannella halotolerans]|uniref:CGNR zinc finger protein n=1 Tax=Naumannella halotolerans TaxID=993414 RepID=A0A4R7J6A5_9ACTN|nr:CGNR zinc finger domain-containing protein [Naumannella halotolerans]TDT32911.1 CGNR zinc finger protein [Naumannella halotolerans]
MLINPYGAEPVRLAVALVRELPTSPAELTEVCLDHGVEVELPATVTDIDRLADFLDSWQSVVDVGEEVQRAARLNDLLARYAEHPRLTDHTGRWHLHYRPDRVGLAHLLSTMITVGTALHLTERGMDRLGRCGASDCDLPFADLSRNGTQRYCSPRCGTREAVRRHRSQRPRN